MIGEIKAFENNEYFSFGGEVSGISKAEIFRFGYFDGKINSKFFSEGVAMDVLFNGYVNVAGLKYEKGKLYHIQIVEPNTN